ncbi:MAG: hypothetical protein ACLVD1_14645, partial [Lacrimispora saccharolytica]
SVFGGSSIHLKNENVIIGWEKPFMRLACESFFWLLTKKVKYPKMKLLARRANHSSEMMGWTRHRLKRLLPCPALFVCKGTFAIFPCTVRTFRQL